MLIYHVATNNEIIIGIRISFSQEFERVITVRFSTTFNFNQLKTESRIFLLKLLTEANPDTDYYFIIGSDMVEYLPKWYKIDELLKLVTFIALRRTDTISKSPYPVTWLDAPLLPISSTMLREMCYVSIFSAATNSYFGPIFIAAEVFGFGSVQYILPIMTIAYVLNGNSSIYAQEVLNLEV